MSKILRIDDQVININYVVAIRKIENNKIQLFLSSAPFIEYQDNNDTIYRKIVDIVKSNKKNFLEVSTWAIDFSKVLMIEQLDNSTKVHIEYSPGLQAIFEHKDFIPLVLRLQDNI